MPYSTEYLADGTGIYHEASGVLTGAEIIAAGAATHAVPETARRLTHALVDFTTVSEFRVTAEDFRQLAAENLVTASLAPNAVVAVVAPQDHIFGSVRMWQVFAEQTGWDTAVFRDRKLADDWLWRRLSSKP
jgi:hypothetical protein